MGINIPEVERQKASKALNCDRQCPLWVNRYRSVQLYADIGQCGENVIQILPKLKHYRSKCVGLVNSTKP